VSRPLLKVNGGVASAKAGKVVADMDNLDAVLPIYIYVCVCVCVCVNIYEEYMKKDLRRFDSCRTAHIVWNFLNISYIL